MPQLNSATFISQIFWLIVSFSLMWLIVSRFIVPKINDIKERRQHKINDYLAAAGSFKQSAEELVARYNAAIEKADQAAALAWDKARSELEEQSYRLRQEMSEHLKERMKSNEEELNRKAEEVKAQVDNIAGELALKIAEKMQLSGIGRAEIEVVRNKDGGNG